MTQLEAVCEQHNVKISCEYGAKEPMPSDPKGNMEGWRVTLRFQGRQLTCDFYQGSAYPGREPKPADVISCLISDAQGADQGFFDWAEDMGYNTDSRKAEAIWHACRKNSKSIRRLLGDMFVPFNNADH